MKKIYSKPTIEKDSLTAFKPLCNNIDYIPVSSLFGDDEEEEEEE